MERAKLFFFISGIILVAVLTQAVHAEVHVSPALELFTIKDFWSCVFGLWSWDFGVAITQSKT
jgi:hypothetical protein